MSKFGALIKPLPVRTYKYELLAGGYKSKEGLPDEYEIENKYLPDIHNQGQTSSCVAHSLCECAESFKLKNGIKETYSTGWNYGRYESRNGYEGEGLFADDALNGAIKIGFVPEAYFDFTDDVREILDYAEQRDDLVGIGEKLRLKSYVEISSAMTDKKWDDIRSAFVTYNSPLLLISFDYFSGGSHAILGYGFTTVKNGKKGRYIKFQNSWGTDYGDNGRSLIPIEEVNFAYLPLFYDIELPFKDVKTDFWGYDDIKATYMSGLVKGVTDGHFEPNGYITRADFALIIYRLLQSVETSLNAYIKTLRQKGKKVNDVSFNSADSCPYAYFDIKPKDYYCDAIRFISANGIMNGRGFDRFEPNRNLTRAEASAIMVRTFELIKDVVLTFGKFALKGYQTKTFTDISGDEWYSEYVNKSVIYGLMKGYEDDTFKPDNTITRAETATLINRLSKNVDKIIKEM